MAYFWINDGAIAGISEDLMEPERYPQGFTLVEGPDAPAETLFWNGSEVAKKPEQPSSQHVWNFEKNDWMLPHIFQSEPIANWQGLADDLTGSTLWAKAYEASTRTLKANSAFTVLLTVLTSTKRADRLNHAIALLREAMRGISAIGDFTADELVEIAQTFSDNGFDPEDFDLSSQVEP
jgi:hypothetical protein